MVIAQDGRAIQCDSMTAVANRNRGVALLEPLMMPGIEAGNNVRGLIERK